VWLPFVVARRARLGGRGGARPALGRTAVLGSRFWDQQARFRLCIGPIGRGLFGRLLPSGSEFRVVVQLARFFVGPDLDFDVQLVLRRDEVPRCRLGDRTPEAPRLGWSTWLGTRPRAADAADAVLGRHLVTRATGAVSAAAERSAA
jgi:type VI secretion system protein ImpH